MALHESFGSVVAQVAEVSLTGWRAARPPHRLRAIDCGTVINPGIVAQQMEGSVVFALTAALHGRTRHRRSGVSAANQLPVLPHGAAGPVAREWKRGSSPPSARLPA